MGLTFSQTALHNWQGGGQDNFSIHSIFNLQIEYKRNKSYWMNKIDAQYGLIRPGSDRLFKKNIDQVLYLSKYNLDAWNQYFYYSAMFDFRTQFAPGYNYVGDSIAGRAVSDAFSPAYIQLAVGLDYKPVEYFFITLSPLAGKMTIVSRQYLADAGAYGVEKAQYDPVSGNLLVPGKKTRYEFGGRLTLKFKKDLNKAVNWDSYLDIFSNYLHNPQNMDVIFNNLLTVKLNKIFTFTFIHQVVYDDDIVIRRDWNKDGKFDHPHDINGPRIQMLSTYGIGLGVKF